MILYVSKVRRTYLSGKRRRAVMRNLLLIFAMIGLYGIAAYYKLREEQVMQRIGEENRQLQALFHATGEAGCSWGNRQAGGSLHGPLSY